MSEAVQEERDPQGLIGEHISWLAARVGGIRRILPSFVGAASALAQRAHEGYEAFVRDDTTEKTLDQSGQVAQYNVPIDLASRHRKLIRTLDDAHTFLELLPRMAIIALVSTYDSYLGLLVRAFYATKPEALNGCNRQFSYSELAAFGTLDQARESLVEREVESLLRESHVAQFEWLENKVGIPLRKDLPAWPTFVELTERRNLFVHADGKVGTQYLAVCRQQKVPLDPNLALGTSLPVDQRYFKRACATVAEIGVKLGQVMWRKLLPDAIALADSQLVATCYELLLVGDYGLATTLGEFACEQKRHSSAERKLMFQINLAQAYKWAGRENDCRKILDSIDWSPLDDRFKLAATVLRDEFGPAALIVRRLGAGGGVGPHEYREWPLFRRFRSDPAFHAAYAEVFGQPFKLVHSRHAEGEFPAVAPTESGPAHPQGADTPEAN